MFCNNIMKYFSYVACIFVERYIFVIDINNLVFNH